jgi:hypothetical protein
MRLSRADWARLLPLAAAILAGCAAPTPQTGMPPAPLLSSPAPAAASTSAGVVSDDGASATYSLTGTRWQLMEIQSSDVGAPPAMPSDPSRYTVQFASEGRAVFQIDCNRGQATWVVERVGDGHTGPLRFNGVAIGQSTCGPSPLGPRVAAALPQVRGYMIRNGRLYMSMDGDAGLLTWTAR